MSTLKRIALTLLAAALPCFAWAEVVYTNTLAGSETLEYNGVAYEARTTDALTTLKTDGSDGDTGNFNTVICKVGTGTNLPNDTQTHTFSMWVKVPELTDNQILWWVCGGSNGNHGGYAVKAMSNGAIRVGKAQANGAWHSDAEGGDGYRATTESCLTANEWAYVTVVITKTANARTATPAVYVNGASKTISGTFNTNLNGNGGTNTYAQIGSGIFAAGVRVDNTALTADEVAALNPMANLTPVNNTWTATTATDVKYLWSTATNWSSGSVPESDADVCILANGTNGDTLTMDAAASLNTLAIIGSTELTVVTDGDDETEDSLTAETTIVNTDADVSDITADLGNVTVASSKTLTIASVVWTSLSGDGTLATAADMTLTRDQLGTVGLKVASNTFTQDQSYPVGERDIEIASGATFDANGVADYTPTSFKLGGTLTNTRVAVSDGHIRYPNIQLTGDATISGTSDFGTTASAYGNQAILLNGHTLTKDGTNNFKLASVTFRNASTTDESEAGTVKVANGTLSIFVSSNNSFKNKTHSGQYANFDITGGTFDLSSYDGTTYLMGSLSGTGGTVSLGSKSLTIGALNKETTYSGAITGSGALNLTGGTLTLDPASTTGYKDYTGTTTINEGAKVVFEPTGTDGKVFADKANVVVNGELEIKTGLCYAKLSGTGDIAVTGGPTIGNAKDALTTTGIQDFSGALSVASDATLTLANWSNGGQYTLTGCDLVVDGTLQGNANAGAVAITVASGKTLSGTGKILPNVTFESGAILDVPTEGALTVGAVTLPDALTVKVASLPEVGVPVTVLNTTAFASATGVADTDVTVYVGDTAAAGAYQLVKTATALQLERLLLGTHATVTYSNFSAISYVDKATGYGVQVDLDAAAPIGLALQSGTYSLKTVSLVEDTTTGGGVTGIATGLTLSVYDTEDLSTCLGTSAPLTAEDKTTKCTFRFSTPITLDAAKTYQFRASGGIRLLMVSNGGVSQSAVNVLNNSYAIAVPTYFPAIELGFDEDATTVESTVCPAPVAEVPKRVYLLDAESFGYGRHALFTYTGEGSPNWGAMTVINLPAGAEIVSEGNTCVLVNSTLKVLPIGDSITAGLVRYDGQTRADYHVPGGYRLPLYQFLTQAGYTVKYLGTSDVPGLNSGANSYENNKAIGLGEENNHHEGHSGAYVKSGSTNTGTSDANGIYERFGLAAVVNTIAGQGVPDVITIHLGTNDIGGSKQSGAAVFAEMKQLIYLLNGAGDTVDGVTPLYPNAKIFVAEIMPRSDSSYTVDGVATTYMKQIEAFNTSLATYVNTTINNPEKLVLVDLDVDVNYGLLRHDGLHPSTEGYSRMAQGWFAAIEANVAPMGAAETIASVDSRVAGRLTVTLDKAAEATGAWTLDNNATVTTVTLANDKRTVTLDVTGVVPDTTYTLTATGVWTAEASTSKTFTPVDIHVPTADVAETDRTTATLTGGVLKAAEWTTFTGLTKGTPYTSPIGYMPESGRAWQLEVRGDTAAPIVTDGVLSLNGAPLTVNPVDGCIGTTLSRNTIVMTVSNLDDGDVLLTSSTKPRTVTDTTDPDPEETQITKLSVKNATTLVWQDRENPAQEFTLTGVDLTDAIPETIVLKGRWVKGSNISLMVNGTSYALTVGDSASEVYQASWSIGAESTVDTGSSMKLHRLSFYEGNVAGFVTTTWTATGEANWADEGNWSNGVPTADKAVVIPAGASITLAADATAKSITIDGTVAISGAFTLTVAEPIVIAEGETLKTTNTTLAAPVTGEGTLHIVGTKYSGRAGTTLPTVKDDVPCSITGLTNAATWTGMVVFEDIGDPNADNVIENSVNNLSLVDFGNADSSITLKNVTGNLDHDLNPDNTNDWRPIIVKSDLHLEGTNTLNNGYEKQVYNFAGAITSKNADAVLQWTGSGAGIYCFTGDISGFEGALTDNNGNPRIAIGQTITTADIVKGVILINDDKEINCTLKADSSIKVSGTLKGAGTLDSEVYLLDGATIDATDPAKILTATGGIVWPEQGTLNVTASALPTEGDPVTLINRTDLTDNEVKQITTLSVTLVGGETVTSGYQVEAKASVGYVLAVREKDVYNYTADSATELATAIDAIETAVALADVTATITLTDAITLTGTLEIDIGDTNTLTINMGGYPITAGDFTAIRLVSGQLTITSPAEAAITRAGSTGATILVAPLSETAPASPTLTLEAGVKVNANANASESAAVDLQIGTIGGTGTLNGNLKLAHHTTIDATIGHLTIANEGIVQFPGLRDDGTGGSVNSTVTILMPDGLVYPQEIIKCANASADHAPGATLYVNDFSGNNYGLTVMVDNQDGTVSAYGLKQYVCVADTERYTTVAAAIADKQTNIYLHANPVENIVIPDGVTLNLAYLGVQYTVVGNVTVQDGGCLRPMGGDVFGNVTFESGSRLDVAYDLQYVDTTEFIVGGKVTFPASNFVVVVGSAAESVAIGEPRQIIRSAVPLEYGTISVTNLQIATGTDDDGDVTDVNGHTKIVTTSFTYEVVNVDPGVCTLDGIDYDSVEQALAALADAGNDVITLNDVLAPDATIVIDVDDSETVELEEVTIDLNGHNLTSTADPAIRIESGKLNLVSTHDPEIVAENPQITSGGYDVIKLGADAEGVATIDAALHIDQSVSVVGEIDVVSGTISGDATLLGPLELWDGAIIDASTTQLTMGAIEMYEQFVGYYAVTFPGTDAENKGTITVIPPAGSAYPVQFIACPGADETYYENTDLLIKMGETLSQNFSLDVKTVTEGETTTVTGYAIATNYAVVRVDAETRNSKAYYATFADAFVDDEDVEELDSDILVLLANVAVSGEIVANIYTNGYDLTGTGTISGSLTLTQGTEIPTGTSISAAGIQIDADATVTINGTIASEQNIICTGTLGGTGTITGALWLMDGATIAQGANFAPTGGTIIYGDALVTIDGALSGSLHVPHATIEGTGVINIGDGKTLTGAGTINPTVNLATGAIIDKSGFEEDHLVLSNVTALTNEVITVKATDLAHVLTAKNAEAPFTAANFTVDMGTSGYVAYDPKDPADYDNNLVIQTVAYNNGHTLGIVRLRYYIGGARIADPTRGDADGVSVAKQLAAYGYRYGILEIKGVDTASSDPVAGFQLFTNVVNGFVGDYLVITYDFGITDITVMNLTKNDVAADYIMVTADVDGVYDKDEGDLSGNANYRSTTTVKLTDANGTAVTGAVEITTTNAGDYGLDYTAQPGVKVFVVPLPEATAETSETLKFKVKATNE